MTTEKTHYRKAFNSPYLSSADITEPTILTIARVSLDADKTKRTKDLFNTAYFVEREIRRGEPLKPMILNATNSKMLAHIAGSSFLDDWKNVPVIVQVQSNVRFGKDTVDGLRLSKAQKPQQSAAQSIDFSVETERFEKLLLSIAEGFDKTKVLGNPLYKMTDEQRQKVASM